jgi:NADH:ubiquinone oxidoreductase subunit F (NADH-binding)/Pyruvate/2-oxoacid:ferredoxin oxidoreductase delta subunit/(2Fe-2S) ferredoxin
MKSISDIVDSSAAVQTLAGERITVGVATCGISAGAMPVLEALKAAGLGIPVEPVGCAGMCFNEPVVTVRKGGVFSILGHITTENVGDLVRSVQAGKVLEKHLVGHSLDEIDYYKKQRRLVMENCGILSPLNLEQYVASGGFKALEKVLSMEPALVIQTVLDAKLRGRGGAGFPTGKKWSMIAKRPGKKYLVCNGDEGDPGAFMNRTLLESDPFRVLEGMMIAAYTIGSDEAFVYTREEYPLAINTMQAAIAVLEDRGLLGQDILGKAGFSLKISVKKGAGAFVCGEETALMNSIMGNRGQPMPRPPYPAERGLWGLPTNINNVDTFGNVVTIFKYGPSEYIKVGTENSKGTKTICLVGKVRRAGVVEVPFGTPIREIIFDIGGGSPEGTEIKAVQMGGPSGGCIPVNLMDTPLDYETVTKLGAIIGSGGMIALNDQDCMVEVARYFMNFTREESCGKCTPCREGNTRLLEYLERITQGKAGEKDLELIRKLAVFIQECSLCGLGQTAPNPVLSTMRYFLDEYREHIIEGRCPSGRCTGLTRYYIEENCVGCGLCARNCPVHVISGAPKARHVIEQKGCIKCGECFRRCPFKAITKSGNKKS